MSCGTAFSCGIHRFDKYKFAQKDKPSNPELHHENEKKWRDLLALREQQDRGVFAPVSLSSIAPVSLPSIASKCVVVDTIPTQSDPVTYYPTSDGKMKQD